MNPLKKIILASILISLVAYSAVDGRAARADPAADQAAVGGRINRHEGLYEMADAARILCWRYKDG